MEVVILLILTGFLWGLGPIFDKYGLVSFSSENALFIRVISSAIIISIFFLLSTPKTIIREFNLWAMIALIGSGLVGFGGVYTFYRLIHIPGVQVARCYAISLAICPLVTAILAYIFYGEQILKPIKLIGIILIMGGIYLLSYQTQH